jgi:hypothetical protein
MPVIVLALFAALMSGCSSPVHKALDPNIAQHADPLLCRSVVQDEEISIHVVVYKGLFDGGLIGKAIDAHRGNAAEERITPLLEQTADVDFRRLYWDALEETMAGIDWIGSIEFDKTTIPVVVTKDEIADRYLLNLGTAYQLTPDCLALMLTTRVGLFYPGQEKAVYYGYLTYFSDPIGDLDEENAILAWAENGAAKYRSTLREGIAESMRMLRADLLDREQGAGVQPGEKTTVYFQQPVQRGMRQLYNKGSFKGELLADDGARFLFREQGGNLWSLPTCSANGTKPPSKVSPGR